MESGTEREKQFPGSRKKHYGHKPQTYILPSRNQAVWLFQECKLALLKELVTKPSSALSIWRTLASATALSKMALLKVTPGHSPQHSKLRSRFLPLLLPFHVAGFIFTTIYSYIKY